MSRTGRLAKWLAPLFACLTPIWLAQSQERPKRFSIWDIHIGEPVSDIPDQYVNYACGTNGGPPSLPIANFSEFKKCKPEADGLHEVYFEYDDELEYWARALELRAEIRMYAGTTVFEFPIVASVLVDDTDHVRGERMVTDPRQKVSRDRTEFWMLGTFLRQRFGEANWSCQDLPPEEGEGPAGTIFIKNHCEKTVGNVRLILETRYFQKKGQNFVDPSTGKPQPEAYESATRFEMYDAGYPLRESGLSSR